MASKGEIVNLSELASLWGVHRNTLNAWVKRGCPYVSKADRSRGIEWQFNTADVAQWKLDRAVQDAIGDTIDATNEELKRRKLAAETIVAELDAARARGEVGDIAEFERQMIGAAVEIRSRMQQLVVRVAPMVLGEKRITVVKKILAEEIDQALTVIADDLGTD